MSHFVKLALSVLAVGAACSSPKPQEGGRAESPAAEPSVESPAAEPSVESPAAEPSVESPAAEPSVESPAAEPATVELETLFVRDQRAECQGEAQQQCLQVRSTAAEPWRNLYSPIEGFEYEPSHAYELRVSVTPIRQAPADSPSLRYRLVEVVSKRKVDR